MNHMNHIRTDSLSAIKRGTMKLCTVKSLIQDASVCNKIVDHSDVVGASPVGAAPTTSSFSTEHLASIDCAKTTARRNERHLSFVIWSVLCKRFYGTIFYGIYCTYQIQVCTSVSLNFVLCEVPLFITEIFLSILYLFQHWIWLMLCGE